ncbi:MAG TPA: caspase family protein, partial [Sphingomonadaceae bacterium]|nr:caspase family protein [Sphingomonadaceae bacterium]
MAEAGSGPLSATDRLKRLAVPLVFAVLLAATNLGWYLYISRPVSDEEQEIQALFDATAEASEKVALLIGNSAYEAEPGRSLNWPSLGNPENDVALVKQALEKIGFKVQLVSDANWAAMQAAIGTFSRVASGADVALFYYAGHGFEFDRRNYLVPTDAPVEVTASQLPYRFIDFETAANAVSNAGTTVFMLDACRNDGPSVTVTASEIETGLKAHVMSDYDFPPGAKVAVLYSTARGVPAKDGVPPDRNYSPFAHEVARNITIPRVELTHVFNAIRKGVYDRTRRFTPPQAPYTYNSLDPDFFLADRVVAPGSRRSASQAGGGASTDRGLGELKPLEIDPERLATTDETVLAVQVLAEHPVEELEALAERGDPLATYLLGYMYAYGVGVPRDVAKARTILESEAAQKTPSGQLELANLLARVIRRPEDRQEALRLFRLAAGSGSAKARGHLAEILMGGQLVARTRENYEAGLELLRLAAQDDYPYAMYVLVLYGQPAEKRRWRAARALRASARDPDADHWLCEIDMAAQDYRTALPYCQTAARAGFADAQAQMALAAFNGWARAKS